MHITPDYIVGLVDGEGSFTAYVRDEVASVNRRARVEPRFYVKLQAVDRPLLDALQRYFDCGNVYIQRDQRKNHSLCYRFEVHNRQQLRQVIVPFFQNHRLQSPSKQKDFKIFCQLMTMIEQNQHLTNKGLASIRAVKAKMHLGSSRAGNPQARWERQH